MPSAAGRDPAAERRKFERLRKMPERQSAGSQLRFERRAKDARLDSGSLGPLVDLQHPVQVTQIHGDHRAVGNGRRDPADHAGAATPGNHHRTDRIAPVQYRGQFLLAARQRNQIGRVGEIAREDSGAVVERAAVAVQKTLEMVRVYRLREAPRRRHAGREQFDLRGLGCRRNAEPGHAELPRIGRFQRADFPGAQALGLAPPAPELQPGRDRGAH
jgi:hypothetical protein